MSSAPSRSTVIVRRDHLLLAVVGDLERVVADDVVADLSPAARASSARLFLLEALAGEAEEDQHDADVHDVAAVAALVAADEADERREHVGARRLLAHARAAPELLQRSCPSTKPRSAKHRPERPDAARRARRPPPPTTSRRAIGNRN